MDQSTKPKSKFPKKFVILLAVAALVLAVGIWTLFCVLDHKGIVSIPAVDHFLSAFHLEYEPMETVTLGTEGDSEEETEEATETESDQATTLEDHLVTPDDPDTYYSENGQVVSKYDASTSTAMMSEADAYKLLTAKGFTDPEIIAPYSEEGEILEDTSTSTYSSDKHPMYQSYYISTSGEIWYLYIIDGSMIAAPLNYNYSNTSTAPLYLSEKDTTVSYDNTTNQFFETIPNADSITLKKVTAIDKATLDSLTEEALKAL